MLNSCQRSIVRRSVLFQPIFAWFARLLASNVWHTHTNAISTLWIIAKVSQKLYYDFMSLVFLTCSACLFDFVGRREVHLKVYWRVVAKHSASRSLIPQDVLSLNGFFLTVFIVAVLFLRIPFTIIWACMEAGRRNEPSIGIKALPILWSSGHRQ